MKYTTEDIIDTESKKVLNAVTERYVKEEALTIVMSHCGVFSQDLVNSLGEGAEELLVASNEKRQLIRKIFSVLIEGLQNIKIHGEATKENVKYGILVVAKGEGLYKITFGNLILNEEVSAMERRLSTLNQLSEVELKERYMKVLSEGILSNKGGAGLGFITMRMKAKSLLNFHFKKISNDKSVFTFELVVKRAQEND